MIHELRIHGLGVIEDAVVPFAPGLTVLTGETGAGKTMLLTGLGLLMGVKGDPGVVRAGSDRADVDGEWRITAESTAVLELLDELGARTEQDNGCTALILGRSVAAEGRSRALAGGRIVPVRHAGRDHRTADRGARPVRPADAPGPPSPA